MWLSDYGRMFLKDKLKVQHPWFSPSVLHLFRYYAVRDGARGVGELSTNSPFIAIKLSNILPGFDDFGLIGTHGSTFFWFFNNCALKFIPKPADYWLGFCQELSGAQARLPTIATAKRQLHSFSKLRYRLPINYQGCRLP